MKKYDINTANHHNRNGDIRYRIDAISAVSYFSGRQTHAEIYPVSWKGSSGCGIWPADCLLPEKCKFFHGRPWLAGNYFDWNSYSITPLEKADAPFYCRGNHLLYAACTNHILKPETKRKNPS